MVPRSFKCNARREPRRWSLVRYAELADCLVERWAAKVIWAWGPGEEELVDEAISLCRQKQYKLPT